MVVASFALGCASSAMCDATDVALVDVAGDEVPAVVSRQFIFGAVGDLCGPLLLIVVSLSGLSWRVAFAVGAGTVLALRPVADDVPVPPATRTQRGAHSRVRGCGRSSATRGCGTSACSRCCCPRWTRTRCAFLISYLEHDHGLTAAGAIAVGAASIVGRARRLHHDQPARLPAARPGDAQPDGRHHRVARRRGARREHLADRRGRARVRFCRRPLLHRAQDAHRAPLPGPGRQRAGGREHDRVLRRSSCPCSRAGSRTPSACAPASACRPWSPRARSC